MRFLALLAVLLVAAGCRTDGGVGRRDIQHQFHYTIERLEEQVKVDVRNTERTFGRMPAAVRANWRNGLDNIVATWNLYFDNHRTRGSAHVE